MQSKKRKIMSFFQSFAAKCDYYWGRDAHTDSELKNRLSFIRQQAYILLKYY